MKRLLLSSCLGVIALAATAQVQPDPSVAIPRNQIELPAQPHKMFPGDFDVYKGAYDLSNGETLTLRKQGRRMYAAVENRPRVELVAAAPNVFVAVDKQLKITLDEGIWGDVTGELLMVVPRRTALGYAADSEVLRLVVAR